MEINEDDDTQKDLIGCCIIEMRPGRQAKHDCDDEDDSDDDEDWYDDDDDDDDE